VGVTKNATDAVKWFQKAAEQNFAEAQYNLGVCYDDGEGVTKDAVQALKWYSLAADQKNENAAKYRAELQKVMTSQQIAEAQKLKQEFKPKSAQ
jgi:TPR repeat protein